MDIIKYTQKIFGESYIETSESMAKVVSDGVRVSYKYELIIRFGHVEMCRVVKETTVKKTITQYRKDCFIECVKQMYNAFPKHFKELGKHDPVG